MATEIVRELVNGEWVTKVGTGGGGAPSGPAGGDLDGSYPNPDVATVDDDVLGSGTPDNTTFLRGDRAWAVPPGGSSPSVVAYEPVLLDADNTAAPVNVVTVTIPADAWTDGGRLDLEWSALYLQGIAGENSGGLAFDAVVAGEPVTLLPERLGNQDTERTWVHKITVYRAGADLWVVGPQYDLGGGAIDIWASLSSPSLLVDANEVNVTEVVAAVAFDAPVIVAIRVTLSEANASLHYNPQAGLAILTAVPA